MYRLERQVIAQTDDCLRNYVTNDVFQTNNMDVSAGHIGGTMANLGSGMRFLNIGIPRGSTIHSAILRLNCRITRTATTVNTRIRCQDADNPLAFSDAADFDARDWTTAAVNWDDIPAWTSGVDYHSPDFAACVQEVINRPGWAPGNALVVLWDDFQQRSTAAAAVVRTAQGHRGNPPFAAILILRYSLPPNLHQLFDRFGRPVGSEGFEGQAYCQVNVAADDSARQFTAEPALLRFAVIQALDNDQVIGNFDLQDFVLEVGQIVHMQNIDASTLYVANETPGQNGSVVILGARK